MSEMNFPSSPSNGDEYRKWVYDASSGSWVLIDVDSDLGDKLDSEHAWNIAEHTSLQGNIDAEVTARTNADSDLNARVNTEVSDRTTADTVLENRLDSAYAWNTAEHSTLQGNIDAEALARSNEDSDLNVRVNTEVTARTNADTALGSRLDSAYAWNVFEHNVLQSQFNNLTTDSVAEGTTNLYYTDQRVQDKVNSQVDSNFLNDRMPLGNLSDVQVPSPVTDNFLQWNGSVWQDHELVIEANISFKGVVDATVDAAPSTPGNGNLYINTGNGTADSSWTGLTGVDSNQSIVWSSDNSVWVAMNSTTQNTVQEVRPGLAIEVVDTNPARPTVAVDKSVTDGWYVDSLQVGVFIAAEALARSNADSDLNLRLDTEFDVIDAGSGSDDF